MLKVNLINNPKVIPRSDREENKKPTAEEDMEKTILKHIMHGLVFVNSKRYSSAFENLM
jgi:hypothetical protein